MKNSKALSSYEESLKHEALCRFACCGFRALEASRNVDQGLDLPWGPHGSGANVGV